MRVKVIAFGNDTESFIEKRINDGVNVIYSDDNNRGKTLVMQGLMYSIGNEPIFPHGFKYKDQYFYSKIELNGDIVFEDELDSGEMQKQIYIASSRALYKNEDDTIKYLEVVPEITNHPDYDRALDAAK